MTDLVLELDPTLPQTPGWSGLDEATKKRLQEKTSDLKRFLLMEGHGAVGSALTLIEIEAELKGKSMSMSSYIQNRFHQGSATANRRLADGKKLLELWGHNAVDLVATRGAFLLQGASGVGMKELIQVAEVLPAPKSKDPAVIEAFFEKKVRPALAERRVGRQAGKRQVKFANDAAQRMIFNSGRLYMRQTKNLHTSAEAKEFIKTVVGWWMEDRGIPGTIECKRIPIPEGTIATVGRPRKKAGKKA